MKRYRTLILIFINLSFLVVSFVSQSAEQTAGIRDINIYGSEWGNGWSGSVFFRLKTMPSGVSYFTVHKDDVAFNAFLTTLLATKASGTNLRVVYDADRIDGNGYVPVRVLNAL